MTWFSPEPALLPEVISLNSRWLAGKPAVIADGITLSWREFGERTARVANALLASGLIPGDRIVLLMGNSPEMADAIFGAMRAGLTVVPLNVSITDDAVRNMIADCGARAVIASDEHIGRIEGLRAALDADIVERLFAVADEPAGWRCLEALRDAAPSAPPRVKIRGEDGCNIIYSSGTTGLPKGIEHNHACRLAWAADMAIALRYHSGARTLLPLGMYSNITWVAMLSTVLAGGTLVIRSRFAEADCLEIIQRERVTHFAAVPLLYQRLIEYERFDEYDLSSLHAYMCCGSPLNLDLKRSIVERMPGQLIELYGLTEGLVTILAPEDVDEKLPSVGRPCPGQDLKIIDNDGNELGPNEPGEIVGISRLMMSGYHANDEASAAATWEDASGVRWLRTGDIGRIDEDGFLYLVDRKKDMIISGGQNVYPADIEAVLVTHHAVLECAVIGAASRKWGETPVAFVVARSGNPVDADELTDWTNSRVGRQQRIAATILVDELPRNPNGKILKRELRKQYASLEF